jgi:hypothetical protein
MKIRKKILAFLIMLLFAFIFSSCVEFYEHISSSKKGEVNIFFKFSFSKKMIDFASQQSGEYFDYEMLLSIFESDVDLYSFLGIEKSVFSNENEQGYYLKGNINLLDNKLKERIINENIVFLPYLENNKIIIKLPSQFLKIFLEELSNSESESDEEELKEEESDENESTEEDVEEEETEEDQAESEQKDELNETTNYEEAIEYIKILFSAIKYRLTISKNFKSTIKNIYLLLDEKVVPVEIIDQFDQYLVEICFSDFIISDEAYLIIE